MLRRPGGARIAADSCYAGEEQALRGLPDSRSKTARHGMDSVARAATRCGQLACCAQHFPTFRSRYYDWWFARPSVPMSISHPHSIFYLGGTRHGAGRRDLPVSVYRGSGELPA
eukprot:6057176-Pyramimonas_sp.AAC.1